MCRRHRNLDWQKYINDEVGNRDDYELALAGCVDCLHEYIHAIQQALEAPDPDFPSAVMAKIPRPGRFSSLKPILHYAVAACLTLILVELGAFDWLAAGASELDSSILAELHTYLENVLGLIKTNLGGM